MKSAKEWFLKYIMVPSASDETTGTIPSTEDQKKLGAIIVEDMKEIGISDAFMDEYGYVYGTIEANCENQPSIGLIAHLDVIGGVPCSPMNPEIIENYDGGVITLKNGLTIDPAVYTSVGACKGKSLIVTDGNTILGADDKAGIAEIMALAERLINDSTIKHGKVKIAFTPDEEIGGGAEQLDIAAFGADFAYTVDGGEIGGIEYENFNAASAKAVFKGVNIHPGSAKNKMKNAATSQPNSLA
ncbi:MAG: tripeptide aminopeptidase PepT [Clostridia bacterium]|nr:tripeptide aminopeptidase PepT [Clostridia bacterium]